MNSIHVDPLTREFRGWVLLRCEPSSRYDDVFVPYASIRLRVDDDVGMVHVLLDATCSLFAGAIPEELGKLSALQMLRLAENKLTGMYSACLVFRCLPRPLSEVAPTQPRSVFGVHRWTLAA